MSGGSWGGLNEILTLQLGEKSQLSIVVFDQPQHSSLRLIMYLHEGEMAKFDDNNIVVESVSGEREAAARIDKIEANYVIDGRGSLESLPATAHL